MKNSWTEQLRFFSNAGKEERERWVVAEFLGLLSVMFTADELRSPEQQSKVDVAFREARFQVKEILNPETHRGAEVKETYHRVIAAQTLQETVGPGFVYDTPSPSNSYDLIREKARELGLSETYRKHKHDLDLLFYITRTHTSRIQPKEIKISELSILGWRSISCLMGNQAHVLFARSDAPCFLITSKF